MYTLPSNRLATILVKNWPHSLNQHGKDSNTTTVTKFLFFAKTTICEGISCCVFSRLINGNSLPLATLLITSQPSHFPTALMPNISYCVEILGFTKQSIEHNAKCMLESSNNTKAFLQYLSINPKIVIIVSGPLTPCI